VGRHTNPVSSLGKYVPVLCAQDRANLIYEQKMAAEKRGEVDLAAKLERDFKVCFSKISLFAQQKFFIS